MNKNTKIYLIRGCYGNWNKVYVGKTINEFSRKNDHRRKYGYDVEYEILEELEGTNRKIWKLRESYWIQYYIDLGFEVQNKQLNFCFCFFCVEFYTPSPFKLFILYFKS